MSVAWPQFQFPFPPDIKILRKEAKRDRSKQSRSGRYTSGTWAEQAHLDVATFLELHLQDEFTSEDFKVWCLDMLHRAPPHHGSVWGAIWMTAFRRGLIEKVGKRMVPTVTYGGRYKHMSIVWRCK